MTRETCRKLLEAGILQAYAEGKVIEHELDDEWLGMDNLAFNDPACCYRIKPEPTLRPWKPEEVPIGAVIRNPKIPDHKFIIMGTTTAYGRDVLISEPNKVMGGWQSYSSKGCEYSTDFGKTWKPCGVME